MATLLAVIEEVAEGRSGAHALMPVIASVRAELHDTQQDFGQTAAQLAPPVRVAVQRFIDQAYINLSAYNLALDVLEEYVRTGNTHTLMQAAEQVHRAMFETSAGFDAFRDAVLVVGGPTDIPTLNLLLQSHEELKRGESPPEKLMVVAERERRKAVAELEDLERIGSGLVKVVALQRAWRDQRDSMQSIIDAVREGDDMALEARLAEAQETFQDLRRLIPAAQEALDSEGPSPAPLVNVVVNLGRRFAEGSLPEGAFLHAAGTLRNSVRDTAKQVDVLAGLGDDASVLPSLEQIRMALETYAAGFAELETFLVERRMSLLTHALATMVAASLELHAVQQEVLEAAERANKITLTCVRCGQSNESGRVRCSRCGTNLPVSEQELVTLREFGETAAPETHQTLIVSDTLRKVYDAINGAADDSLGIDDYMTALQWFEDYIAGQMAQLQAPLKAEQEDILASATDGFTMAIAELRRFADDHDKQHLVEGGRLCNDAAHILSKLAKRRSSGAPDKTVARIARWDDAPPDDIVG